MNYKNQIKKSEDILTRLKKEIHSTFEIRHTSKEAELAWSKACEKFHQTFQELSFLDGIQDYRLELRNDNKEAIEYALCFLEVRPYFHRSGYMWHDFLKILKNCNLSTAQRKRYETIRERYKVFKEERESNRKSQR